MDIALRTLFSLTRVRHWLPGLLLLGCLSVSMAQAPLNLPFFEDFSTALGRPGIDRPDATRWQPGSGVYINNTMAINQPTVNVASFDGLMANGLPYVQNNQLAQGYTDTLASLPITLAGLKKADNVYFSFYWQIKGLGESPDPGDSLTLQFLDRTGVWQTIWKVEGGSPNNNFPQEFIQVDSSNYFHNNFAFRFRSYGRQSGPFDTWNIDYIYLNKGRAPNDRFIRDIATRLAPGPLLKRYTSMPLAQYLVNPAGEMADSVRTDITNQFNNFNPITFLFTVRDDVSGRLVQDNPRTFPQRIQSLSSLALSAKPTPVTGFGTATRAVLRYKFDVLTTDDQNPSIPGVNLRQNDTISATAALDDYYAYDDGTAEYGLQIGQRERVAVRFILNKADVISGVRASIVPFRTNQTGQPFVISVYSNANGRPGTVVYQKSFATKYPTYRNGFIDFPFDQGVPVKDTFYVGYQQISSVDTTLLRLGFDKNSPFGAQIFYNGGSSWDQNLQNANSTTLNFQGAFMLRPVMGGKDNGIITATPEPEPIVPLQTYPNPTTGLIHWNTRLTRLEVMNVSGRLIQQIEPSPGQSALDLSYLPDGLYLLRLYDDKRVIVQKLIIQH